MHLEKDFYRKVEQFRYLKHVLYGDTDSIFLKLKIKNAVDKSAEELWEIADYHSKKINQNLIDHINTTLLPRCNINPDQNTVFFKTELLMSAIMLLDVKKQYSYKLIVKEGNKLKKPEVYHTGIQIVKSDTSEYTKQILETVIENIILNEEIPGPKKLSKIIECITNIKKQFDQDIENFEFNNIATNVKYGKNRQIITAMKLYNYIVNEEIFNYGSSGKMVYCDFTQSNILKKLNILKCKSIVVPYVYDKELLKEKFKIYNIHVDSSSQWSKKIYTKTCQRIVNLVKQEYS